MNLDVLIALASLGFTALGSAAAVIGIRQNRLTRRRVVTVDHRFARRLLRGRVGSSTASEAVLNVISRFIFVSGTGRTALFGTLGRIESSVFLDFLTACTDPGLRKVIAGLIVDSFRDCTVREKPTYVAVPKEGNVLLADEVAKQLNLGLVIVRTIVPAIRFGNPIEGTLAHGAYVIIVDDIVTHGAMLVRVAQRVRRYGGRIEQAFCAVELTDYHPKDRLKACDVDLFAPIKLDEATLRQLRQLPASGSHNGAPATEA
jgi:orotate phosphoribosyltransferase